MASPSKSDKEGLMKDLKVGVKPREYVGNVYVAKDGSSSDAMSCISSVDATGSIKGSEVDQEALIAEQILYYPVNGVYGYYYPGFDGSIRDWEDNGYYFATDAFEIQHAVTQPEHESLVYYYPGFHAGYSPYNLVSPGAMFGDDGQCFTQHLYQPNHIFHQPLACSGFVSQPYTFGAEVFPAYILDSAHTWDGEHHGSGYASFAKQGVATALSVSHNTAIHSQAHKSTGKAINELSKGFVPTSKCNSYPNTGNNGLLIPSMTGNAKTTGIGTGKQNGGNPHQGPSGLNMLNGQNCGPRTTDTNNSCVERVSIKKEGYNLSDFSTKYDHALFFVIKSYSEDDVHKSIKYNVWASTPNGNKRLDGAYQVAREKAAQKGSACPVFLYFSVNASGQFCGVAEMIAPVDFTKSMDFWQQDKWNGYFPVKWHIIKDIPNPQFRHIILENNDNKPVTNSRDTQEVKFAQGTEMLNIFKNYSAKTSILDDFSFYESRQKAMQEKKIKLPKFEHLMLKPEAASKSTNLSDPKAPATSTPAKLQAGDKTNKELQAESNSPVLKDY